MFQDKYWINLPSVRYGGGDRFHNLKNGNEASEVTEGKSSRMGWGR